MRKILVIFSVIASLHLTNPPLASAQCPMCRMSAEMNMKNGGTAGNGLNSGILYMLAAPYLLFGIIGYMYWKNNKLKRSGNKEE